MAYFYTGFVTTALGLIQEETVLASAEDSSEEDQIENTISYIEDYEHFTEIFRRMTEVEHNLKIATANLKNFNVQVESENGVESLRLCVFFL